MLERFPEGMNITIIILLAYMLMMLFIAWLSSRKESLDGYFLNNRKTRLWILTFSNVATIVGAGATVAIVSEVYNSGISYGIALPLCFIVGMILLGIIAKRIQIVGRRYKAYTMIDFFERRFGPKNKNLVSVLQIIILFLWIGLQSIAIATLASVLTGIDYNLAIMLAVGVTITYTALGGMKADIMTDFIQFWIIFIVFIIMAIIGYGQIGSLSNLFSGLPEGHLDIFGFGGVGWFIGAIVMSGFFYVANTSNWQRILAAKDAKTARRSFFYTIPFLVVISIIILFLGLLAAVTLSGINQDYALYSLMDKILPPWILGLGFASILAVVMSSVDSVIIGGSTIVYRTVFKKNKFENRKELIYARLITATFGIIGGAVAFMFPNMVILSLFVSYLTLIFVPAAFAALYSKNISGQASFYSILIPSILLIILFPFVEKNTFMITTPLSVMIILFYDKIFKKPGKMF